MVPAWLSASSPHSAGPKPVMEEGSGVMGDHAPVDIDERIDRWNPHFFHALPAALAVAR